MQRKSWLLLTALLLIVVSAYAGPGPPGPPVPIDGGLTALLVAGGAMGYRAMKKKKEEL